jgi:hypothetical protein
MAEPFKNLINAGTVAQAGQHLQRAWPAFDRARFESLATTGLETLELKARAMHLADALEATLPEGLRAGGGRDRGQPGAAAAAGRVGRAGCAGRG